jgi:hypothetical protein
MSRKLEDLEELALEPTCVGEQVSGRYLEMLEEVCSFEIRRQRHKVSGIQGIGRLLGSPAF